MDKDYTTEQVGDQVTYLGDRSKLDEAFLMAETGAIAYVEEFSGKKFVILTLEKFDEIFDKLKAAEDDRQAAIEDEAGADL